MIKVNPIQRFVNTLPQEILSAGDYHRGSYRRPKNQALKLASIGPNSEKLYRNIVIDVDHDNALTTWIDQGLPRPSFIVTNLNNRRAHVVYTLAVPISRSNLTASRYARAVWRKLNLMYGGDPHYNQTLMKNPLRSDLYVASVGREEPFTLDELSRALGGLEDVGTYARVDDGAEGRNRGIFDALTKWAAKQRYKGTPDQWFQACHEQADFLNQEFETPLGYNEVKGIAKSVSGYWYERQGGSARKRGGSGRVHTPEYLQGLRKRQARGVRAVMDKTIGVMEKIERAIKAYPKTSNRTLGKHLGLSEGTIRRYRAKLVRKTYIRSMVGRRRRVGLFEVIKSKNRNFVEFNGSKYVSLTKNRKKTGIPLYIPSPPAAGHPPAPS